MIINDRGLDAVVWVNPKENGQWGVHVGDLLVFRGTEEQALNIERKLKDGMVNALKIGILSLTSGICELCQKRAPLKKRRIKGSLHLFHWNGSLGWQACEADYL